MTDVTGSASAPGAGSTGRASAPGAGLTAAETDWLRGQLHDLLGFGRGALNPTGGFGWLDERGALDPAHGVELWITCRMTHVFGLATVLGDESARPLLEHGIAALTDGGILKDPTYPGWFGAVDPATGEPTDASKEAYSTAFVVLAAATARAAGVAGADELLEEALTVVTQRFWREGDGMVVDKLDRAAEHADPYRGVNANMHTVEALLAAHDVTGDPVLLQRVERIVERVVNVNARANDWRIPEHYDETWTPLLDYNEDKPADKFRPYGATPGHGIEWSRLLVQASRAVAARDGRPIAWALDAAIALQDRAIADGWNVDGGEGIVYTTGWDGQPVVHERMHWVAAEALATEWTLWQETGDPRHLDAFRRFADHADRLFVDRDHGSWHHELDAAGQVSSITWDGKPDVYHAYQTVLLPLLPAGSSFVGSALVAQAAGHIS